MRFILQCAVWASTRTNEVCSRVSMALGWASVCLQMNVYFFNKTLNSFCWSYKRLSLFRKFWLNCLYGFVLQSLDELFETLKCQCQILKMSEHPLSSHAFVVAVLWTHVRSPRKWIVEQICYYILFFVHKRYYSCLINLRLRHCTVTWTILTADAITLACSRWMSEPSLRFN